MALGEAEGVVHAGAAGLRFDGKSCIGEVSRRGKETPFWLEKERWRVSERREDIAMRVG